MPPRLDVASRSRSPRERLLYLTPSLQALREEGLNIDRRRWLISSEWRVQLVPDVAGGWFWLEFESGVLEPFLYPVEWWP